MYQVRMKEINANESLKKCRDVSPIVKTNVCTECWDKYNGNLATGYTAIGIEKR